MQALPAMSVLLHNCSNDVLVTLLMIFSVHSLAQIVTMSEGKEVISCLVNFKSEVMEAEDIVGLGSTQVYLLCSNNHSGYVCYF